MIGSAGKSATDKSEQIRRAADNWEVGGDGERLTGERLEGLPPEYVVLHDLHVRGSKANIDHLVIGPDGVFVLDTKAYSWPLEFRNGMVWRGKYPLRKELAAVERYSADVSDLLGLPVTPVLCFVDNVVPPEARLMGKTHLVALDELLGLLTQPWGRPIGDIEGAVRLACTLRTPTPAALSPTPAEDGSSNQAQRQPPEPRRRSGVALVVLGVLCTVLVVGCVAALTIGAMLNLKDTLIPTTVPTTTIAPPPLDGPTIEVPTASMGIGVICPVPGAGWQATFGWPASADPKYAPVAVEVTSFTPEIAFEPLLWLNLKSPPPPITGLGPGTTLSFSAQGILADGTRLTPTGVSRDTPATPC